MKWKIKSHQRGKLQAFFLLFWRPRKIILNPKLEGKFCFSPSLTPGSARTELGQGNTRQTAECSEAQERDFQTGTRETWETQDPWRASGLLRISQSPWKPRHQSPSHIWMLYTFAPRCYGIYRFRTCLTCASLCAHSHKYSPLPKRRAPHDPRILKSDKPAPAQLHSCPAEGRPVI